MTDHDDLRRRVERVVSLAQGPTYTELSQLIRDLWRAVEEREADIQHQKDRAYIASVERANAFEPVTAEELRHIIARATDGFQLDRDITRDLMEQLGPLYLQRKT
jgi:hypothetical protein